MGSKVSFRIVGALVVVLALAALTPETSSPPPDFGQPLAGLPSDLVDRFNDGKAEFQSVETPEEGIGPVFNDVSCANCHNVAAVGGGSATLETRFGTTAADGTFDPLTQFGGSLMQVQGIGVAGVCEYLAEIVPPEATITTHRRTTPLFGLGLVDAVPDSTFYAIATEESHNSDGITGTVSVVTGSRPARTRSGSSAGRARTRRSSSSRATPTSTRWASRAPQFPDENCPQGDCAALSCNPDPRNERRRHRRPDSSPTS